MASILVVEDITAVRHLIRVQLEMRGHSVVTARDGEEALEIIAKQKPAVVVTDILMPRVDGFALAYKLRLNPQTADLPIIFLSATYVSADDERLALGLGAMRFLPKPVEADELLRAVEEALQGKPPAGPNLSARAFYASYRQRLESKLRQKAEQILRYQQMVHTATDDQQETYRRLLDEAQAQHDEIQRELTVLVGVMQEMT